MVLPPGVYKQPSRPYDGRATWISDRLDIEFSAADASVVSPMILLSQLHCDTHLSQCLAQSS